MKYDKQFLYNAYNATRTGDGNGELETYERWLERQLISRIEHIELIERANGSHLEKDKALHKTVL